MVAPVPSAYAVWLKSPALYAVATVAGVAAAWGDLAVDSTIISPLAALAPAQAEADYQAAFLAGPLAQDGHTVKGARKDLIGQAITLTGDRLGYEGGGAVVFVTGAVENDNGTTTLTVLKRL